MFGARRAGLILRGGVVYDGTGRPPLRADVRVEGDRIAAIGPGLAGAGDLEEVDLDGLALAPGFIDIHSHTDLGLLVDPRAESKIRQGVTTEVAGQDGSSVGPWSDEMAAAASGQLDVDIDFRDLGGFFARLERDGMAPNVASMVGAGTVRQRVIGLEDRPASANELARMVGHVAEALAAGACGLSSGLEYLPGGFASTDELVALAAPLRSTGLPYASHMRNEDDTLLAAIEEALAVGAGAGVPAHVSHLKALGGRNWWKGDVALELIDRARAGGADVTFDVYPYTAYATSLGATLFPLWAREGGTDALIGRLSGDDPSRLEAAAREKVAKVGDWGRFQITSAGDDAFAYAVGRNLDELAADRGVDPWRVVLDLIVGDRNRAGVVVTAMTEANVERALAHPAGMVCSDGSARATDGPLSSGAPHPRTYGSFPRLLGRYVRDRGVLPLEAAIAKVTDAPARRLRLVDRGVVAPGAYADLVAFDPTRVADLATFDDPHRYPTGLPHVLVNGTWVLRDGERTDHTPGRVLRPG
ncbi:MAG: D-aminoacylase [Myxococcota bacterium]